MFTYKKTIVKKEVWIDKTFGNLKMRNTLQALRRDVAPVKWLGQEGT